MAAPALPPDLSKPDLGRVARGHAVVAMQPVRARTRPYHP
jgi:hypothetical protein